MLLLEIKRKKGVLDIIHFVGIGGIGMSGIAEIMNNLSYKVQGSDLQSNNNTQRLEQIGIKIFAGHQASNIKDASYVVVSSAIKENNPEVIEARKRKVPVIRRAEMLAELMRLKCSIAISGSHGKTTTTSLVACLFEAAKLDPTVINGGIINNRSTNAYLGQSDYLIAEADESDATFIKIPSTIGVITNIDPEHMDYYKNFETLIEAFKSFMRNLPFYGFGVACVDHPVVRNIVEEVTERRIITYGIDSENAHIIAYNIKLDIESSTFDIKIQLPNDTKTTIIENITLPTAGKHNVLNALAAVAIGVELDFGVSTIQEGFKNFHGVKRRFTKICKHNGAEIIDDYAHHPVEIKAALSTARLIAEQQGGKVIAIFQPHRYSRLENLWEDFSNCFSDAHNVYITDVYAAGESPIDGADGKNLATSIAKTGIKSEFIPNHEYIADIISSTAKNGDIVMLMGAGTITNWANQLPMLLKER
ncbi:MAG: UDP-N-acetylmuramate--L-alanine ligase [Rickettsiaceae bacterium]|nr:UDP-N-acetylmuramate--L-alanine ligase [Rickettsiaceae bacterium]